MNEALAKLLTYDFRTVLDIGSGRDHAEILRKSGKVVTTNNLHDADVVGDYLTLNFNPIDCIWASHVLEHQPNPNLFIKKCYSDLKYNGILAVTVPPLKHQIVGGHVNLYNAGILLYQLILGGFDCSNASVRTWEYNISVIVRKTPSDLTGLVYDNGDIHTLRRFFPLRAREGFYGRIEAINW